MILNFTLYNQEFEDSLAVYVNGLRKELSVQKSKVSFDVADANEISVQIEYVKNDTSQIRNPIAKFFSYLLLFLISLIVFFSGNGNGIDIHKFFYTANPFKFKKVFKIVTKCNEENIVIEYIEPPYNKVTKMLYSPDIIMAGACIIDKEVFFKYNTESFKKDFRLYHYPAYIVLFTIMLALNALIISCIVSQLSPFNFLWVIGLIFCELLMIGFLLIFILYFVSTHKLFKEVDKNLRSENHK